MLHQYGCRFVDKMPNSCKLASLTEGYPMARFWSSTAQPESAGQQGARSVRASHAAEIMEELDRFAGACGHELQHVQENSEGVLVEAIHKAATTVSITSSSTRRPTRIPAWPCETHCWPSDSFCRSPPVRRGSAGAVSADFLFFRHRHGCHHRFQGESYMLALQAIINQIEP